MPTENRSSNTELISQAASAIEDLLANGTAAVAARARSNLPAELRKLTDQPAPQPHTEPIAWTVGTAFWWSKEEAERDSAATGLPIIGLGAMVDPVVAERLRTATDFVQRMVECAGTQQSVATGYVRDILDVLKGSAAPSAPVELQRMTFEYVHADGERHTVALSREEVAGYMDEFLFEKLTEAICHCESIGETNVVECRCDEVAEQYKLANPA